MEMPEAEGSDVIGQTRHRTSFHSMILNHVRIPSLGILTAFFFAHVTSFVTPYRKSSETASLLINSTIRVTPLWQGRNGQAE